MVHISPFCAVRPASGLEEKIAALPYDVYSRAEALGVVKENPMSFLKIDRAETNFSSEVGTYDDVVYEKAKELLASMINNKDFIKDEKPCFYLYEQTMNGRSQTGLVCVASVDDYVNNVIKKHENTRADKEVDRIRHISTVNAQTGPIFLACRDHVELKNMFSLVKEKSPYFDFTSSDDIRHRGWIVDEDEKIKKIVSMFSEFESLYIADGHHRCASAVKVCLNRREGRKSDESYEDENFLSVVFPESELMIMDYNRVVYDLNGYDREQFIEAVSKKFDIKKIELSDEKPSKKGDIYMLFSDAEYCISLKPEFLCEDPVKKLDVSILQDNLLAPVLNILDPKTDKRIDFIGGIRGVKELRRRLNVDGAVAFSMYPTLMSELFDVADAGLLMPPKSTWFEPKLRSGLFIHSI